MNQDAFIRQNQARISELQSANKKRVVLLVVLSVLFIAGFPLDLWELSVIVAVAAVYPFSGVLSDNRKIERFQNEIDAASTDFERFQNECGAAYRSASARLHALRDRQDSANRPRCPTCGSYNVQPISTASRVASVAAVGLASSKIGKTFQCLDCKYKW